MADKLWDLVRKGDADGIWNTLTGKGDPWTIGELEEAIPCALDVSRALVGFF